MNKQAEQAEHVALTRIRELKAAGRSLREIAAQLQQEGSPPPRRGGQWHHVAVQRLLRRADRTKEAPPPAPPPSAASAPEPDETPSFHIALDGPCTPADRRLWFALVRVARAELGQKPSHQLPRAQALALLTTSSAVPGPADLWAAMKRLRASGITWEAQLENRPLSITAPLLSGVLTDAALTFHFSPELVTLLLDEAQFTRLRTLLGREHDRN